jgi:L-alanine-DL-glutamate epimerase-like enolase superfamily enzyme
MHKQLYILNLIDPFGISRATRTEEERVIINVEGGWGEAAPISYYGEDENTVFDTIAKIEALDLPDLDYVEDVIRAVEAAIPGNMSARAAFDIALHDRIGKKFGVPLYRLFGRKPDKPMVTSFTIGIDTMEVMLRKVDTARAYDILKIKLGRDIEHDLAVMTEIRRAVGNKILRVDANCGWTLDEARRAIPLLADLGVEYVEQPLDKGAFDELRELKKDCPLPIFLDEDIHTSQDIPHLAGVVDGINIKLMKTGGISEARRMISIARALGLQVMLGCMIESSIAITAAAHLGPFVDHLDLDGNLLISNDPFTGAVCDPNGRLHLPELPGLGVGLRPEYSGAFPRN